MLCYSYPDGRSTSGRLLEDQGVKGVIVVNDQQRRVATFSDTFPRTVVNSDDGSDIQNYINSTRLVIGIVLSYLDLKNLFGF